MVRETPLHLGHLRSMAQGGPRWAPSDAAGAAFYAQPETVEDIVGHSVGHALDLFGLDSGTVKRWGEPEAAGVLIRTGLRITPLHPHARA